MSKDHSERVRLAGVLGCPIAHSKSPVLHNHWLRQNNIRGYYVPLHIEEKDFEAALRALPKIGFRGVNVTLPHKKLAADIADIRSKNVDILGVANTLTFCQDGRIKADNTDVYGFSKNLKPWLSALNIRERFACVLGAGGASRGVVLGLLEMGFERICIANRTRQKAEYIAALFGEAICVFDWAEADEMLRGAGLVVNTTSLGMGGGEFPLGLSALSGASLVTDIVYTPLQTGFLKKAAARGAKTIDGLGMLLHQAVPGFEAWFGVRPSITDETRRIVLEAG